jgi:hypothetical protein
LSIKLSYIVTQAILSRIKKSNTAASAVFKPVMIRQKIQYDNLT